QRRRRRPLGQPDPGSGGDGRGRAHGGAGGPGRATGERPVSTRPIAIVNARIVDPASGTDGPGAVIVRDGLIAEVVHGRTLGETSADLEIIDAGGAMLAPGLIDLRVKTG